jgi:hypothetical protein
MATVAQSSRNDDCLLTHYEKNVIPVNVNELAYESKFTVEDVSRQIMDDCWGLMVKDTWGKLTIHFNGYDDLNEIRNNTYREMFNNQTTPLSDIAVGESLIIMMFWDVGYQIECLRTATEWEFSATKHTEFDSRNWVQSFQNQMRSL